MDEQQPGQVISPASSSQPMQNDAPSAYASPDTAQPPTELPQPVQAAETPPLTTPQVPSEPTPQVPPAAPQQPSYQSEMPAQQLPTPPDVSLPEQPPQPPVEPVISPLQPQPHEAQMSSDSPQPALPDEPVELAWTAAEYLHAEKGLLWYFLYIFGTLVVSVLVLLVTKDYISSGIVFVASMGLIYVVARKPQEQAYALDQGHLAIGRKWYSLQDFKAFSVDDQHETVGVTLVPLKRFMPPITAYLDSEHHQAVVDYLAQFLPVEPHKTDAVDSMLRRLRL